MASGDTFLTNVEDGLNTMVASARQRRQFPTNVMPRVVDRDTLTEGTGTAWREFLVENLTAQNYNEADEIDNPQQLDGSVLTATPQLVAIQTFIGKRVQARLDKKAFSTFGTLGQNAIEKKKNTDGHAMFAAATTTLGGTGTTTTFGHVLAAARRITSDATEPGPLPIFAVLHGYQVYDIQSEILAGVGTYPIPEGMSAEVFRNGFKGMIGDANVYEDGTISVDSSTDVTGGIGSKMSIVLVQGISPWRETRYEPQKGYGGWSVWLKDEYVYVERSSGNWLFGLKNNATAPSS